MSKLLKIAAQRRLDVAASKQRVSESELLSQAASLQEEVGVAGDLSLHLRRHWRTTKRMAVAAEFKRASPSKGEIAVGVGAEEQALKYAAAGAVVVSVLTEPQWFQGSLEDMRDVRRALKGEEEGEERRVLVLRKDFIVDEYQLLEAAAFGADTVLLIVAILDNLQLRALLEKSRQLGMEPLVEVANEEEMHAALQVGAKVIGVNNRNLHTFKVDMNTTLRMVDVARNAGKIGEDLQANEVLIIGLSGIKTRADVVKYEQYGGVAGILVGETLMRAPDPKKMIGNLVGLEEEMQRTVRVKICGITRAEDAVVAAKAGADMIGIIFVQKSKRHATVEQAKAIVRAIRDFREMDAKVSIVPPSRGMDIGETKRKRDQSGWFGEWANSLESCCDGQARPLVVGVFMDQPVAEVNRIATEVGVDLIQLHGSETLAYEAECCLPVVRVIHIDADAKSISHTIKPIDVSLDAGTIQS